MTVLSSNQNVLRQQNMILSMRNIIAITVCDHNDNTATDSKGHKSWLPTKERRMQDQSLVIMDDLKLYGKNSNQIASLVQAVWNYPEDIGMKFGIDKCAVLELERGRLVRSEGIELNEERMSGERMIKRISK